MADNQSIVAGMFSTPEQYQQQQLQQLYANQLAQAQLSPIQQASFDIGAGAQRLGNAVGGLMGVEDPQMKALSTMQGLAGQFDTSTAKGLQDFANALREKGLYGPAAEIASKVAPTRLKEAETTAKLREKPANMSEFERLVEGLDLNPEQKRSLYAQRAQAMLNPDPNGLKALNAQLAQLHLDQQQFKFDQDRQKAVDEKNAAITKLSNIEGDIDTSLSTAAKAIKLAPTSFLSATGQTLGQNIPWSDQKSLKNLVSALNSEKAINTLQDLKAQSKTGATGFGALNQAELQLILDKTRALDPTDKMFKENLTEVMQGWNKIRSSAVESRINLQGKTQQLQELRTLVNTARQQGGFKSQAEKDRANALKAELGVN